MQKILTFINNFINNKVYSSVFFIVFGLFLIFFPFMTLEILSAICGVLVVIKGIFTIIDYCKNKAYVPMGGFTLFAGIIEIIIGLNFVVAAYMIMSLISTIFGIFLIYNGIKQIKSAGENDRYYNKNRFWTHFFGVFTTVLGFVMTFLRPFMLPGLILKVIGICLVYYGISILIVAHFNKKDEDSLFDDDENE